MTTERPQILLADDHQMFSQGLRSLLEAEFDLVGIVADGQTLVETARRLEPDVIVVDISMPVMNGFDAVRQLKKQGAKAK
ncbi:MAG TPA: response regulator transcription factor, partial [Pyrinomonadaceae bacterium]|nr:response regulator transcription factor [Pyrinomonadaceae bacterium]